MRRPEGQGLNDLYVRFFRMAERRIAEKDRPGRGLLHLQLFMAGRPLLHRYARALPRSLRRHPHRLPQRRQVQDRQDDTGGCARPQHLLHVRRIRWAFRWARRLPRWCARLTTRRRESVGFRHLWGQIQARRTCWKRQRAEPKDLYAGVAPLLSLGLPFADLAVSDGWAGLAGAARPVPDLVPGSENQPGRFPG